MSDKDKIPQSRSIFQLIVSFFFLLAYCAANFLIAGDWHWMEGWIFSALFFAGCMGLVGYLFLADPGLLNERFNGGYQTGESIFDRAILTTFIVIYCAWFALIPLDAHRFHWSPEFPFWIKAAGAVFQVLTFLIIFLTFKENSFAAPVVKLQKERGQKVISTGVYAIVRHPMYAGAIFMLLGPPLLLGSIVGVILGILMIVMLSIRSIKEEETLKQGLEGYEEYMKKVRWRLIPYIF